MSKESRLCYHAVPRILKTDITWINESIAEDTVNTNNIDATAGENTNCKKRRLTSSSDNYCNDTFQESLWSTVADLEQWKPFGDYISDCRINMNVRQVLDFGEESLHAKINHQNDVES